jgi:hypothetical protein
MRLKQLPRGCARPARAAPAGQSLHHAVPPSQGTARQDDQLTEPAVPEHMLAMSLVSWLRIASTVGAAGAPAPASA